VVRTNAALGKLENFIFIEIANGTIHPSITSFSDGSLMVAYTLQNSATDFDIVAKRVDSAGTVSAPITLLNETDRSDFSDLATLANGNFVAVFQNEFDANVADHDIFFTIRAATGATVAPALFVAGANDTGDEVLPHVAALADGGFVVTWADSLGDQNGTSTGIRASIYDAGGGLVRGNILANVLNQGAHSASTMSLPFPTAASSLRGRTPVQMLIEPSALTRPAISSARRSSSAIMPPVTSTPRPTAMAAPF
jgi:hypothetical protein